MLRVKADRVLSDKRAEPAAVIALENERAEGEYLLQSDWAAFSDIQDPPPEPAIEFDMGFRHEPGIRLSMFMLEAPPQEPPA